MRTIANLRHHWQRSGRMEFRLNVLATRSGQREHARVRTLIRAHDLWRLLAVACAACDEPQPDAEASPAIHEDEGADRGSPLAAPDRCGNGVREGEEACDDGNRDPFDGCTAACAAWPLAALDPVVVDAPLTWQAVPVDGALCRDGSPARFHVNTSPGADKLIIYLEQGGACLPETCLAFDIDAPFDAGIFDRGNQANPFADWNYVYVPYCTADFHAGSRRDVLAGGKTQQFVGYDNMGFFLERIVPTFRQASRVVLTGASAGGFGSTLNFPRTQDAFGPVEVLFLDDSGPWMSPDVLGTCLQDAMREGWNLDATALARCGSDCADRKDWAFAFLEYMLNLYPDRPGGFYSSQADASVRLFYGASGDDCHGADFTRAPAEQFTMGLRELREFLGAWKSVGTYFSPGEEHMCFNSACFYAPLANNTRVSDWVADLLRGDARDVGL